MWGVVVSHVHIAVSHVVHVHQQMEQHMPVKVSSIMNSSEVEQGEGKVATGVGMG